MQELSTSIQERIKKTKQVIENNITADAIRSFRQQQKIRCEKENFILAMIRANKLLTPSLKKSYLHISEQLMTLLEPSFKYKKQSTGEQDFLNDFVQLYTSFFAYFEDKFTFKTKIKNFLRPTNHNLIVDLIKYFVDFTRDYYVQTLFWKMRNSTKTQNLTGGQEHSCTQNCQEISFIRLKPINSIPRSFSYYSEFGDITTLSPRKRTADENQQKRNNLKNYDILQVSMPTFTTATPKEHSSNVEPLKIRINELFREQKSRNGAIKKINQDYLTNYYEKHGIQQNTSSYLSLYKRSDHLNMKCHPLKFLLQIQKSGFSLILLEIDNKKIKNTYLAPSNKLSLNFNTTSLNSSPLKASNQNSLSPLKITQRLTQGDETVLRGDYFLTSMKVLRVSQNFLPPLFKSNSKLQNLEPNSRKSIRQNSIKLEIQKEKNSNGSTGFSLKLKKMAKQVQQQFPLISEFQQTSQNVLVRSTSFKNSTSQQDKRRLQKYNNQLYAGEYFQKQMNNHKISRRDSQESNYRTTNKKIDIKKRIIDERKSYQSGVNVNSKIVSKISSGNNHQSEEKILHWLQKIKNLKEIQRKKILGMNF